MEKVISTKLIFYQNQVSVLRLNHLKTAVIQLLYNLRNLVQNAKLKIPTATKQIGIISMNNFLFIILTIQICVHLVLNFVTLSIREIMI